MRISRSVSIMSAAAAVFLFCLPAVNEPVHSDTPDNLFHLRDIADTLGLYVGVIDTHDFGSSIYLNTVPSEFNSITAENLMKFEYVHPCPPPWLIASNSTVYNWVTQHGADRPEPYRCTIANSVNDEWEWEYLDQLVSWAAAQNMGFRGHTLLWYAQNPEWLTSPRVIIGVADRERIMTEHIQTVITHYCSYDNIYAYDVVNEAILGNGRLRAGIWSIIPNYIDKAFRTADAALTQCGRPDVKLYYNDYGIEYGRPDLFGDDYGMAFNQPGLQAMSSGNKTDAVYQYFANLILRSDPTPVDGIGMQTHLRMNDSFLPHNTSEMVATMNRFTTGLGLEIAITEMDVAINSANPGDLFEKQATQYSGVAAACIMAINCTGLTTWGVHDGTSWIGSNYRPLMFYDADQRVFNPSAGQCVSSSTQPDRQYCPKPAYYAVYGVFAWGANLASSPD